MGEVRVVQEPLYRDENWLTEQYWGFDLTSTEMGKITGCSDNCIFEWFKKYNIPTKGKSWRQIYNDKLQRKCSCCQQFKDESEFYKQKNRNYGKTECKKCRHDRSVQYTIEHRDEINKRARNYWQKNNLKDKYQIIRKKYRETHEEQIKKYHEEYYQKNKNECLQKSKKYRQTNPEKEKQRHKIYNEKNRKKVSEYSRQRYLKQKGTKERNDYLKKLHSTESFKIAAIKYYAKRRRKLKIIPLFTSPFPEEIHVDYHHINDLLVVPIPSITHEKCFNPDIKIHKEKCKDIIQNIHGLDLNNLIGGS